MHTDLLYDLLDVDRQAGPAELLRTSRAVHQLPYLVLSLLAREEVRMGEPARAELRRARARTEHYAELARGLEQSTGVRAIRGLRLAGYYPPGLLRPQGDLELVAPGEAALWQAVVRLVADHPVEEIGVTVFGGRPRHTAVTLNWPAADPLVDPWYRVGLCTAALAGDLAAVPVRPVLVAEDHVECLIALAEEGLRRAFQVRDVVDVLMLAQLPFDPVETAALVAAYRLAPEAAALLDLAAGHVPLGRLAAVRAALEREVDAELRRREAAPTARSGWATPPRHGVLLRRVVTRDDWDGSRCIPFEHGDLLLTPVADYLLPAGGSTARAPGAAALAALRAWDAAR
ncbi:hypothetical protein OG689_01030 [Kitasatospora sp. NBC_00240]|uniref:hypothetical protein n=1 Tax=Kitasatospora sp. NBC_00240 TaxID=2903567 RepID=UPI00224D26C3|nr:hypothetical protein [Kitasatospora sp. NBC_00240]MCX5207916.1 hypothetical protein [Kitasatospora sp. NBC_00240]